ncbi:MAG: hypothetical protein ACYC7D_03835 [Nitrososphaerales archaeon]
MRERTKRGSSKKKRIGYFQRRKPISYLLQNYIGVDHALVALQQAIMELENPSKSQILNLIKTYRERIAEYAEAIVPGSSKALLSLVECISFRVAWPIRRFFLFANSLQNEESKKMAEQHNRSVSGSPEWIIIDLLDARGRLRKLEREINQTNDRGEISLKMEARLKLQADIMGLQAELANRIPDADPIELRLFSTIHRALEIYGKGISESILWSFERETGLAPVEILNHPKIFSESIVKIFGELSAKRIESAILFEIGREFRLQLSRRTELGTAMLLAKSKATKRK